MIAQGVLWDFLGKSLAFLSRMIFSVILTRLLDPKDFGLFGTLFLFISLIQGFADAGLASGLVQIHSITKKLQSSVFWLNALLGVTICMLFYMLSPLIAKFYANPDLTPIGRVLAIILFVNSLGIVHQVLFRRDMDFKSLSIIQFVSVLVSGLVAVRLAFLGFGVWSLIYYELVASVTLVALYWLRSSWIPAIFFSWREVKKIWSFSSKRLVAILLNTIFSRLDYLVVSKSFPVETMGHYTRAKSLGHYVNQFSSGSLANVLFPAFSRKQDDLEEVRWLYKRSLKMVALISVFLSGILFLIAEDLFLLFFGDKWLVSAGYFKLMAINGYVFPVSAIMLNLVLGLGRANDELRAGFLKKALSLIPLGLAVLMGIEEYLLAMIVHGVIALLINLNVVNRSIGTTMRDHFHWIFNTILSGFVIVFVMMFISFGQSYVSNILLLSAVFTLAFFGYNYLTDSFCRLEIGRVAWRVTNKFRF